MQTSLLPSTDEVDLESPLELQSVCFDIDAEDFIVSACPNGGRSGNFRSASTLETRWGSNYGQSEHMNPPREF